MKTEDAIEQNIQGCQFLEWIRSIGKDEHSWDEFAKSHPREIFLLDQIMPSVINHLKGKCDQLKKLSQKTSRKPHKGNIDSFIYEFYWFNYLISKGWSITIEPDSPNPGPDCLAWINNEYVYFEIANLSELREKKIVDRKRHTLANDLNKMSLPGGYVTWVRYLDAQFDTKNRNAIIKKIASSIRNNPTQTFYISAPKGSLGPSLVITDSKPSSEGCCLIEVRPIGPSSRSNAVYSYAYWPKSELIKAVSKLLEDKFSCRQFKESRINYLVVDISAFSYPTISSIDFEQITRLVKRYPKRLDYLYGLFLLERNIADSEIVYTQRLIPNPKKKNSISKYIYALSKDTSIKC